MRGAQLCARLAPLLRGAPERWPDAALPAATAWGLGAWRLLAGGGASSARPPAATPRMPYVSADDWGRPSVVSPGLTSRGGGEASSSGGSEADAASPPLRGRKRSRTLHAQQEEPVERETGQGWTGEAQLQARGRLTPSGALSSVATSAARRQPGGPAASAAARPSRALQDAQPQSLPHAESLVRQQRQQRSSPSPEDAHYRDRALTYRLRKASSLEEVDSLLESHSGPPNPIHMAAAARQAILLGSLPRPADARALLDKHTQRMAQVLADQQRQQSQGQQHEGEQPQRPSVSVQQQQQQARGSSMLASSAAAGGQTAAGEGRAAAPNSGAADVAWHARASEPQSPPLRELADVLWAYGKLRCQPPDEAWQGLFRPLFTDPAVLQLLRDPRRAAQLGSRQGEENGEEQQQQQQQRSRNKRHLQPGSSRGTQEPDTEPAVPGQELGKLAVAMARMRSTDMDAWRSLARCAAAAAPGLAPRALSSVLWAFGSARIAHAPLLLATVRAVGRDLHLYNGQDLVCTTWALARLSQQPGGAAAAAAGARAAEAASAAAELLHGELSHAVRRAVKAHALKPAELTTLLSALDEMVLQQEQRAQRQGAGGAGGSGSSNRSNGDGDGPRTGPSRRLLSALSQAVRKQLALLPVGALADAASLFHRLGHHDAGLQTALAYGMQSRARYMEPRHVVRAVTALRAAGHDVGPTCAALLEVAASKIAAYKAADVLALAEACSGLVGAGARNGSPAPPCETAAVALPPRGHKRAPAARDGLQVSAVHAFFHAAIQQAVAAASRASPSTQPAARHARKRGLAGDAGAQSADSGQDGSSKHAFEPLRLWMWHCLLRAATAAGWKDPSLSNKALDCMLAELRSLRTGWLASVRAKAAAQEGQHLSAQGGSHGLRMAGSTDDCTAGAEAAAGADATADAVARLPYTAALLQMRDRLDAVSAATAALLGATKLAAPAAAAVPEGLGSQRALRQLPGSARLLSPAAVSDLREGLAFFAGPLDLLEHRATRGAVQLLQQQLALSFVPQHDDKGGQPC